MLQTVETSEGSRREPNKQNLPDLGKRDDARIGGMEGEGEWRGTRNVLNTNFSIGVNMYRLNVTSY